MYPEEEKIKNYIKITFLFLFTLLGVVMTSESFMILVILYYMAFIKRYK